MNKPEIASSSHAVLFSESGFCGDSVFFFPFLVMGFVILLDFSPGFLF